MQNPITKKSQQGFTLIELLIVVAIIGILAAIAIPQYASYRTSAMNSGAQSEVKNVQTSLEGYYTTEGYAYPDTSNQEVENIADLDFTPSDEVHIFYDTSMGNQTYAICGYHEGGDKQYAVNSSLSAIQESDCNSMSQGRCTGCDTPSGGATFNH